MHGEYGDPAPFSNLMVVVNVVVAAVVVAEGADGEGEGVVVGELLLVGKDCDVVTGLVHSEIS